MHTLIGNWIKTCVIERRRKNTQWKRKKRRKKKERDKLLCRSIGRTDQRTTNIRSKIIYNYCATIYNWTKFVLICLFVQQTGAGKKIVHVVRVQYSSSSTRGDFHPKIKNKLKKKTESKRITKLDKQPKISHHNHITIIICNFAEIYKHTQ